MLLLRADMHATLESFYCNVAYLILGYIYNHKLSNVTFVHSIALFYRGLVTVKINNSPLNNLSD